MGSPEQARRRAGGNGARQYVRVADSVNRAVRRTGLTGTLAASDGIHKEKGRVPAMGRAPFRQPSECV